MNHKVKFSEASREVLRQAVRDLLQQGAFAMLNRNCQYMTHDGRHCIAGQVFKRHGVNMTIQSFGAIEGMAASDAMYALVGNEHMSTAMDEQARTMFDDGFAACLDMMQRVHDKAAELHNDHPTWSMKEAIEGAVQAFKNAVGSLSTDAEEEAFKIYTEVCNAA